MRSRIGHGLLALALLAAGAEGGAAPGEFRPAPDWDEGWYARIETSKGRIVARLLPEQAPQAVAHFAGFAEGRIEWSDPVTGEIQRARYYDGTEVYRAEGGALFQVGDRSGLGGFSPFRYLPEEGHGPYNFDQGYRLGMVRTGSRTSAARFLVTAAIIPALTRTVPCFGAVVSGEDVIFDITAVKTQKNGRPLQPVRIDEVRIFRVGNPAPLPEPIHYIPEVDGSTTIEMKEGLRLKNNPRQRDRDRDR